MSKDWGNKDIATHGALTRFGAGRNCPYVAQGKANKPWAFRRAARLLAGTYFTITADFKITLKDLLKPFCGNRARKRNPNLAEILVAMTFYRALQGDMAAQKRVMLWVDGPVLTEEQVRALEADEEEDF